MGLRLTHRDESPLLAATDSKWVTCDFRRSAMHVEDALIALPETASELERSDVFQSSTTRQKLEYRDVLSRLRDLIHDFEQDCAREQLAS